MVVEGCELLMSEGPPSGVGSLSYASVFRRFKATTGKPMFRARVHGYFWGSIEDFRNDSLAAMVRSVSGREGDPIHAVLSMPETGDRSAARSALREIVRQSSPAGVEPASSLAGVQLTRLISTLQMVAKLKGAQDSRIVEAARLQQVTAEDSTLESLTEMAGMLGGSFSYPRLALGNLDSARVLARLLCAIWPGTLASHHDALDTVQVKLGSEGTTQTWDILSIARLALIENVVEFGRVFQPHLNNHPGLIEAEMADTESPTLELSPSVLLRQELLAVAAQITEEHGLGHGAERITYSRVFRRIRASTGRRIVRAQVHKRIWNSQLEFQHEVLGQIVETETPFGDHALRSLLTELSHEVGGSVPRDPFALLTLVAQKTLRLRHLEANNRDWLIAHCVSELHWHSSERPADLTQRIRRQNQRDRERQIVRVLALSGALGLEVKPELGISQRTAAQIVAEAFYHLGLGIARREALFHEDPAPSAETPSLDTASHRTTELVVGLVSLMEFLYQPRT